MTLVIRAYTVADTLNIVQLFHDTVHAINRQHYSPEQLQAWAPEAMDGQRWEQRLADHHTLVAELNGVVVGFGDFAADGHLDCFYGHKDYQRMGIGSQLLAALEQAAQDQGIRCFWTEASITARPFFERRGFVVLQEQQVMQRGVAFTNYRMEKQI